MEGVKPMLGERTERKRLLARPTIRGPITAFPADVGWTTAVHRPVEVHLRKMGVPFVIVREDGREMEGQPGDYLMVDDGGVPTWLTETAVEQLYMEPSEVIPTPISPLPSEPVIALTEQQKTDIRRAADDMMMVMTAKIKDLVASLTDAAKELNGVVTASPTRPPLFACPFCDMTDGERPKVRTHVVEQHLLTAFMGGLRQ